MCNFLLSTVILLTDNHIHMGYAKAQAVSHRPLNVETWLHSKPDHMGLVVDKVVLTPMFL